MAAWDGVDRRVTDDPREYWRGGRRDEDQSPAPLNMLTTTQRRVLERIDAYERATGEACSASLMARWLSLHHSTVQEHFAALHRKGWLVSAQGPAKLRQSLDA